MELNVFQRGCDVINSISRASDS